MKQLCILLTLFATLKAASQNPLSIPPVISGSTINLSVQSGSQVFYTGYNTPTYGINGTLLAPTIILNKGDSVNFNVTNNLNVKTTLHWHGLHVAPQNDGGPHQIINPGATWSPGFKIRNNASTYWYHPHGAGQTDPQVSKGIAGFFIVHDADEMALNIPKTYGVDDFPICIQTKEFDILKQIAIAGGMDTAIFMNGTLNAYLDLPAQIVRLRLLNGSSQRAYNIGLSNNQNFYRISSDGGLLEKPDTLTRLLIAPGERYDLLLDLNGMASQTLFLKSYASELPHGIYGADSVGDALDFPHDYYDNPLNGTDFNLLQLNIVTPTTTPVTTIPATLVTMNAYDVTNATKSRTLILDTLRLLPLDPPSLAGGPFGINSKTFDMDSINEVVYLNTTEIWTLVNNTLVAHPFHIHDVEFNVIEESGNPIPPKKRGWKDVVLVMPDDSIKFITRFEDFSNDSVPYMYHCHLLHHEDDGMMGSFVVVDSAWSVGVEEIGEKNENVVFPNPAQTAWQIKSISNKPFTGYALYSIQGELIQEMKLGKAMSFFELENDSFPPGQYVLTLYRNGTRQSVKLIKQ